MKVFRIIFGSSYQRIPVLSSTFFNAKSSFGMCGIIPQCEDLRVAGSPVVTLADFEGNVDWSNAVTLEG